MLGLVQEVRPQNQVVDVGPHEAAIGIGRGADDRLAADVKRGVHEYGTAGHWVTRLTIC